jgi:hypothetical protein
MPAEADAAVLGRPWGDDDDDDDGGEPMPTPPAPPEAPRPAAAVVDDQDECPRHPAPRPVPMPADFDPDAKAVWFAGVICGLDAEQTHRQLARFKRLRADRRERCWQTAFECWLTDAAGARVRDVHELRWRDGFIEPDPLSEQSEFIFRCLHEERAKILADLGLD